MSYGVSITIPSRHSQGIDSGDGLTGVMMPIHNSYDRENLENQYRISLGLTPSNTFEVEYPTDVSWTCSIEYMCELNQLNKTPYIQKNILLIPKYFVYNHNQSSALGHNPNNLPLALEPLLTVF